MGIFSSKEKESDATKPSGYQNQNKPLFSTKSFFDTSKHKMKAEIYAEIIPGKTLPAAVPPLKIIINQHVANAAIDSIRDSQQLADELSKGLIIDLLVHPQTPNQFGTLLKYTFAYEDILLPTRDLLFWSLKLPHIQQHLFMQTRTNLNWWLANYGKTALYPLATQWILNPETRTSLIVPLLQYTCRDPENVMTPLAVLIAEAIPYAKVTHYPNTMFRLVIHLFANRIALLKGLSIMSPRH